MVMDLELVRRRRADIKRIAAEHGARNVRVFGSVARGEVGPDSDLDVLVRFESGRSLLDLIGLQQDLSDLLGCKVDVVSEGGISPYLNDDILGEAIPL
jgi:predicted nucleotidyltransferase